MAAGTGLPGHGLLLPPHPGGRQGEKKDFGLDTLGKQQYDQTREKFRAYLKEGRFDDRDVELEVEEKTSPMIEVMSQPGMEDMDNNLKDMIGNLMPKKIKKRKLKVPEAFKAIIREEADKLIDNDKVIQEAVRRAEQNGIIFIDEVDISLIKK